MHPLRYKIWYRETAEKIIGPHFFENDEHVAVNVNSRALIENVLRPKVENQPELWFQSDGATAPPTLALFWRSKNIAYFLILTGQRVCPT